MIKVAIIATLLLASAFCYGDFTSSTYQAQKRNVKQNQLWSQVISDAQSADFYNFLEQTGLLLESMDPTLNHVSDQLPEGRRKLIHSVGTVAKAEFVPTEDSPYTGFFQGADSLIIRFSLAKEPSYLRKGAEFAFDNFIPGFAMKFLIDGQPSANLIAMPTVNGVYSFNFFDADFKTHIPNAQGVQMNLVFKKFATSTPVVQYLGTRKLAEHTQDGKAVPKPKFPYMISLRPVHDVKSKFTYDYSEDFRQTFKRIPAGTTIFEVYATENPQIACQTKIGYIKTTSIITSSYFGDTGLFFQHQEWAKDLEVQPEWTNYSPFWKVFGTKPAKEEGRCPFASLFN